MELHELEQGPLDNVTLFMQCRGVGIKLLLCLALQADLVCGRLKMPWFRSNPLFMRTIECLRKEE
jgi:hypothetical protein